MSRNSSDTTLSKRLAYILRHGAGDAGVCIGADGYVAVSDLLGVRGFEGFNSADIRRVVQNCPKKRFEMTERSGAVLIRASQGHTITNIRDDLLLVSINESDPLSLCIHGTYSRHVASIRTNGLSRMRRNHIHFAESVPDEGGVISGMRGSCEAIVTVDMKAAIAAGIPFYRSSNGVILSPGLGSTGVIPPEFIVDISSRHSRNQCLSSRVTATVNDSAAEFYCVIDFEATCVRSGRIYPQEIIEFPAVLIDGRNMSIIPDERGGTFHSYVRPECHPELSDFCTELTGIQQSTVDAAPGFEEVFSHFGEFLENHGICDRYFNQSEHSKSVIFVTHGDWDLKTMLPAQCGGVAPKLFRSWLNVKDLYRTLPKQALPKNTKKKRSSLGMAAMLNALGMELIGRHHSGIDDTRNISRIFIELVKRGAKVSTAMLR